MPLPPNLLAKLSKRGILTANVLKSVEKEKRDFKGVSGCPNKNNIYHECNYWCENHWRGVALPDPKYARNILKLTQKYPLPHNWMEVFDKGTGKYYFWDLETNMVSWLPPKHPKCAKTDCAAALREKMYNSNSDVPVISAKNDENDIDKKKRKPADKKPYERENDYGSDKKYKYSEKERNRKRLQKGSLDPMDPASYSDIAPGTWSDGLEVNKSAADSTVSGTLYQQRPYPAPGEVLMSNKAKSKKK